MVESVAYFWGIVGCLAVAAACNHGWHHARDHHLTSRLHRARARHRTPVELGDEAATRDDDVTCEDVTCDDVDDAS